MCTCLFLFQLQFYCIPEFGRQASMTSTRRPIERYVTLTYKNTMSIFGIVYFRTTF